MSASDTSAAPPSTGGTGVTGVTGAVLRLVDRHRVALFVALALLFVAGVNGQWRLGPDTVSFVQIARSVAEGEGFAHPHGTQGHAQPVLVYMIAGSFEVFGVDVLWPVIVLIELMAVASLVVTYRLFNLHADRPTAVLVTLLLGVSYTFFRLSHELLKDMPFMLGALLLLWGHERAAKGAGRTWVNVLLMLTGVAWMAAFRIVVITVVGAWLLAMLWRVLRGEQKRRNAAVIITLLGVLAVVRFADPRATDEDGLLPRERYILNVIDRQLEGGVTEKVPANFVDLVEDDLPNAMFGNEIAPGVDTILSVILLVWAIGLARRRALWGVLVAAFVAQWLLFLPAPRYALPIMPLLLFAWWRMAVWVEAHYPRRVATWAAGGMMVLLIGMNVGRTIGFVIEQRRVPFLAHYQDGRYAGVPRFAKLVGEHVERDAVVLAPVGWSDLIMYHGRRLSYPTVWMDRVDRRFGEELPTLYAVTPDEDLGALLKERGWRLGEVVVEMERPGGGVIELRRVVIDEG